MNVKHISGVLFFVFVTVVVIYIFTTVPVTSDTSPIDDQPAAVAQVAVPHDRDTVDNSDKRLALMDQDVEALRGELSLLRDQLVLMKQELQDKEFNTTIILSGSDIEEEEIQNQVVDDQERIEEQQLAVEDKIYALENQMYIEDEDVAWSANAETSLYDAFASLETNDATILSVACRTSLCRMEVSSEETSADEVREALIPRVGEMMPQGVMHEIDEGGGQKKLVFYMARNGYDLPGASE